MMQITVPDALPPDRKIIVQTPSGHKVAIQVPPNVQGGEQINVQMPATATSPVTTMSVVVPPGVKPGDQIRVQAPNGQTMAVVVPAGLAPGQQMRVQMPVASAAARPDDSARASQRAESMEGAKTKRKEAEVAARLAAEEEVKLAAVAAAEGKAASAAAEAEEQRVAAAAAARTEQERMATAVEQAIKATDEAAAAADDAAAAADEAKRAASAARTSMDAAQTTAELAPDHAAAALNASHSANSKLTAAEAAAQAAAQAAEETRAAADGARAASTAEYAEGSAAAARGAASTARVERSKAASAAKHAAKYAQLAAAALEAAEGVAYAGVSTVRVRLIEAVVAEVSRQVATAACSDAAAEAAEAEADRLLMRDLGGKKALDLHDSKHDSKKCICCGDFTVEAERRGGKCVHCFDHPDAINPATGKRRDQQVYLDAEIAREQSQVRLQCVYAKTPLSLEADELRAALDDAREHAVGVAHISYAARKLQALETALAHEKALDEALTQAEAAPSVGAREALACKWAECALAGASMASLRDALERLRRIERLPVFVAEASLRFLATRADAMDPQAVAEAAEAAEATVEQARVRGELADDDGAAALREPREALAAAREKYEQLEDAASQALLLAIPRPMDDRGAVDHALGRARQVGVDMGVGKRIATKATEPSVLTLSDVATSNESTQSIASQDVSRFEKSAALASGAAADAITDLRRCGALLERANASAEARMAEVLALEEVVRLDEAVAKATFLRLHSKERVSYHHRHAVEKGFAKADKGWEALLLLREKLCDDEATVRMAVDELARATHSAAVAEATAAKAAQLVRWVTQEEAMAREMAEAHRSRSVTMAEGGEPDSSWAADREEGAGGEGGGEHGGEGEGVGNGGRSKGGGGWPCCGGGASEVEVTKPLRTVDEKDVSVLPMRSAAQQQQREPQEPPGVGSGASAGSAAPAHLVARSGGNPLFELVDGLAWMPLKVSRRRVAMLEGLTASGALDNSRVCELIAREMCALDAVAASELVDSLTRRLRTVRGLPSVRRSASGRRVVLVARSRWRRAVSALGAAKALGLKSDDADSANVEAGSSSAATSAHPPVLRPQHSSEFPIPEAVLAPVAEAWLAELVLSGRAGMHELFSYLKLLSGIDDVDFVRTLHALVRSHHTALASGGLTFGAGATGGASGPLSASSGSAASLEPLYLCIETILEHSRRHSPPDGACILESRLLTKVWYDNDEGGLRGVAGVREGGGGGGGGGGGANGHTATALERTALHFRGVLAAAESGYAMRAKKRASSSSSSPSSSDAALERVIFAFVACFVCRLDDPLIVGFRSLVPMVFDVYLAKGSPARSQLSGMLRAAGFDAGLVSRIHEDDSLVRQPFFWSAAGMKLFGDHPELRVTSKLHGLITEALTQEPMIVASFIELLLGRAAAAPTPAIETSELRRMLLTTLKAMLAYIDPRRRGGDGTGAPLERQPPGFAPRFMASIELILYAISTHHAQVFEPIASELARHAHTANLLQRAATAMLPQLGVDMDALPAEDEDDEGASGGWGAPAAGSAATIGRSDGAMAADVADAADVHLSLSSASQHTPNDAITAAAIAAGEAAAAASGGGIRSTGKPFETGVILGLAQLFIFSSGKLAAFRRLVPHCFGTHLLLSTPPRDALNASLAFDSQLVHLVSESDDLVCASFFWHGHVLPLFIERNIAASFPTMNRRILERDDGRRRPLYPEMLDLLLRLNIRAAGGDGFELARRTREVLEQFERNPEQQAFILRVFERLDERTRREESLFDGVKLTLLTEVAQNGVHTLESVAGNALCERAMKTLLEGYIGQRAPLEWSQLFKEAANVAYMVKYMFRESLEIAKERFGGYVTDRANFAKVPFARRQHEVLSSLIAKTFDAYGEVGIFDPSALAEIDFLNQPQLLVRLVMESANRGSRKFKLDMLKMNEVTAKCT